MRISPPSLPGNPGPKQDQKGMRKHPFLYWQLSAGRLTRHPMQPVGYGTHTMPLSPGCPEIIATLLIRG